MNLFILLIFSIHFLILPTHVDGNDTINKEKTVELTQTASIHSLLERHMNRFETVRRLLQSNQNERVVELQSDIEESISFIAEWESSRRSMARGINARTGSNHTANRLANQFFEEAFAAENARMEFSMAFSLYTSRQEVNEDLIERLDSFIEKHRAVITSGYELIQWLSEFDIPSTEILYGPSIFNGREGSDFILENTRTEPITNLNIRLESMRGNADGILIDPSHIRRLGPGEIARFRISVPSNVSVDELFQLTVEGEEAWVQENVRIYTEEN